MGRWTGAHHLDQDVPPGKLEGKILVYKETFQQYPQRDASTSPRRHFYGNRQQSSRHLDGPEIVFYSKNKKVYLKNQVERLLNSREDCLLELFVLRFVFINIGEAFDFIPQSFGLVHKGLLQLNFGIKY